MNERSRPANNSRAALPVALVSAVLIFICVVAFQLIHQAYSGNLTRYPDEAAHFVTGVCVLDYFKTGFGSNPVRFAEEYYARFPKVAFGHWPPLFYVLEALWYGLIGANIANAMLLAGSITATATWVLFNRAHRLYGLWTALLCLIGFFSLYVVRSSALMLMSDMLASLLSMAAIFSFADWWTTGARRFWILSITWTILAVLTKESALALLVFIPVAPFVLPHKLAIGKKLLRIAFISVPLLGAILLLYTLSGVLNKRGVPEVAALTKHESYVSILAIFIGGASVVIFLIALYGVIDILFVKQTPMSKGQLVHVKVALLWIAAIVASQLLFRQDDVEERYFLSAYLGLLLLFAQGLSCLAYRVTRMWKRPALAYLATAAIIILCIVSTPPVSLPVSRTGYAEIAAAIPFDSVAPTVLVLSDALGEGAIVSEWLIRDKTRAGIVLRASKLLSNSDWMGAHQKLLVTSSADLQRLLQTTPVRFIVLDMYGFIQPGSRPYDRLLEDTISQNPGDFHLLGNFSLFFDGTRRSDAVQLYENLAARYPINNFVRVDMKSTFGRVIDLRLKSVTPAADAKASMSARIFPVALAAGLANLDPPSIPFSLAPSTDTLPWRGDWGRIYVSAPPLETWSIKDAPAWVQLPSASGAGNGTITYQLTQNLTNEIRSAVLRIRDQAFSVRQLPAPFISIPFVEHFNPADFNRYRDVAFGRTNALAASRWTLEGQAGVQVSTEISAEGHNGSHSLVVHNLHAYNDTWDSAVYLSKINVQQGANYRATLWLKAEHPSTVALNFEQTTKPFQSCGLSQTLNVSTTWQQISIPFQVHGNECEMNNNRLSLQTGRIDGRLWISNVAIRKESP